MVYCCDQGSNCFCLTLGDCYVCGKTELGVLLVDRLWYACMNATINWCCLCYLLVYCFGFVDLGFLFGIACWVAGFDVV